MPDMMSSPNVTITVPDISPATLYDTLTSDPTFAVRWAGPRDPVYYHSINRPVADVALRQLMIAKALSRVNICLAKDALYPFVVQPKLSDDTSVPVGWVWDTHGIIPYEYHNLRLAYIIRLSGTNPVDWCAPGTTPPESDSEYIYDGLIRCVFCANRDGYLQDFQMFYVDYDITGSTIYQRSRFNTNYGILYGTLSNPQLIDVHINQFIQGQITFKLLDQSDADVRIFFDTIPVGTYNLKDSSTDSYNPRPLTFGSGLLTDSAYNLFRDVSDSDAVPQTRQIIAGTGLTGGGDLTADRTIAATYGGSGGDYGSASTLTRSDHIHDGRYFTETESDNRFLIKTSNLSDVTNATISRNNLNASVIGHSHDESSPTASELEGINDIGHIPGFGINEWYPMTTDPLLKSGSWLRKRCAVFHVSAELLAPTEPVGVRYRLVGRIYTTSDPALGSSPPAGSQSNVVMHSWADISQIIHISFMVPNPKKPPYYWFGVWIEQSSGGGAWVLSSVLNVGGIIGDLATIDQNFINIV